MLMFIECCMDDGCGAGSLLMFEIYFRSPGKIIPKISPGEIYPGRKCAAPAHMPKHTSYLFNA